MVLVGLTSFGNSKLYKSKLPNPPGRSEAKIANLPSAKTSNEFSSFSVLIG